MNSSPWSPPRRPRPGPPPSAWCGPCSPPSATPCAGRARCHRRIRDVRHPRPRRAPGSQSANRGARRHRGLEGAVVQGGEGPSRRGQRIAWRAKRPAAGRSSRQRRRDRCTPSPCIRAEALGLEDGSFPCACVRPIDEPALHASRGRLTGDASRMRSFGRQSAARPDLLDSDCSFAILEWCRSVVCAPVLGQSTSGVGGDT